MGLEAQTLRAGQGGLRAIASFDVPEAGLYSVTAFVTPGSGQRFLVDGCRKAIVCPSETSGWRPIMSQTFAAGRHSLVLTLGEAASLDRLRIERKKSSPPDYVATVRRLGFDPGPPGPVSRSRALDAMRFVRDQRRALHASLCGDNVRIDEAPSLPVQIARATAPGPGQPGTGRPWSRAGAGARAGPGPGAPTAAAAASAAAAELADQSLAGC